MTDIYKKNVKSADIIIGCILRDKLFSELRLECNAVKLTNINQKDILTSEPLDLLLYQSPPIHKYDDIETLTSLCKRRRIPSVYWDTDGLMIFDANLQSIKLFDYVFTTEKYLIDKYKKFLCHNRIYHLPYAIQPKLYHPDEQADNFENELQTLIYSSNNARLLYKKLNGFILGSCEQDSKIKLLLRQCDDALSKNYLVSLRNVFSYNTYTDRITKLLYTTGIINEMPPMPGVSVISAACNADDIEAAVTNYERQSYPVKELIILHGDITFGEKFTCLDGITFIKDLDVNNAVKQCKYPYASIFGTQNSYCCNFLSDLMLCFKYTGAAIAGKLAYYIYDKNLNKLEINNSGSDYKYTNMLADYSAVINRAVFDCIKFNTDDYNAYGNFIKAALDNGFVVFSSDKYNFVSLISKINDDKAVNLGKWLKASAVCDNSIDYLNKITY